MNTAILRFATKEPTVCAVCRRRAVWIGYAPLNKWLTPITPPVWLCGETECCNIAWMAYHNMSAKQFDKLENEAMIEAGATAGAYLEELDNTDLARLTEAEWHEFLRRIVNGYGETLKRKIVAGEAPF